MEILDFCAIDKSALTRDPFDFIVVDKAIKATEIDAINRDYPEIEQPANFSPKNLSFGPAFQALLDDLNSAAFTECFADKFNINLTGAKRTISIRKYSESSDGHIHTDHWSKIVTILIYFNSRWDHDGGRLRFLRSKHDIENYAAEVAPLSGTLVAFRRNGRSYHGYKPVEGERRMLQLSWVRSNRFAWQAQQLARFGTHTAKRLTRLFP